MIGASFDSTKTPLQELLARADTGKLQLPDFQRTWVWDDDRIRGLLASVSLSFPIGAVMLLETGGENVGGWRSVKVLEECYALEDEESMRRVMAEPRKLQGPITGVVKNGGKIATTKGYRSPTANSSAVAFDRRWHKMKPACELTHAGLDLNRVAPPGLEPGLS